MKTGLRKQLPQKRRIQRPSGEQDTSVGSAMKLSQLTVSKITNIQSITSHSYIKSETASRGGFAIYKDASNRYTISADLLQIRGNWKINATSIYTGTEDHSGYTANAGDITLYSDGSNASIHTKNFYIDASGNLLANSIEIELTETYGGATTTALWAKAKGTDVGNVAVYALADTAAQANVAIFADAENGTLTNYAIQTVHGEVVIGFGSIYMYGKASANADDATYGQIWVKAGNPTELWFTADNGTDTKIV